MVTEDVRDSQAVLEELNNSGDPYYVAYVRDEEKHDLVEVPQRRRPDTTAVVSDDVEMQTIDGIEPITKPTVMESGSGKELETGAVEGDEPRPYEVL